MRGGGGGGGGQTSLRLGYCCIWLSELLMMVFINQLSPLLTPPSVHSIRSVMQKYLEERDELTFDKIFNQKIGKSQSDFLKAHYPLRRIR